MNRGREKFGWKTSKAVVRGYAQYGGYQLLNFDEFKDHKRIKVVTTRHVRVNRFRFPLGELEFDEEVLASHRWSRVFKEDDTQGTPVHAGADGRLRCDIYNKIVTGEPATCPICVRGRSVRREVLHRLIVFVRGVRGTIGSWTRDLALTRRKFPCELMFKRRRRANLSETQEKM